jgi:hypothetical protein
VLPEARFESAAPLRAASQAQAASGRAQPLLAADRVLHPPAARACRAQARLQPGAAAQLAVLQPRAVSWRAVVPAASPDEAAEPRQGVEAQQGGAVAERQPAAARAAAGVQRRAVAVVQDEAAAALQPEVVPDAAGVVRQREAPDVPAAARPSAVPWVCRRDRLRPWLGQARAAHPAHAMRGWRIA